MSVQVLKDAGPYTLDAAKRTATNALTLFRALLPVETPESFEKDLLSDVESLVNARLDEQGNGEPVWDYELYDLALNRLFPYFQAAIIENGLDARIERNERENNQGDEIVEYVVDIASTGELPPLEGEPGEEPPTEIKPPRPGVPPPSLPPNPFPNPPGAPPGAPSPGRPPRSGQPSPSPIRPPGTGGQPGKPPRTPGFPFPPGTPPGEPPPDRTPPDEPPEDEPPEGEPPEEEPPEEEPPPEGEADDDADGLLLRILKEIRKQGELSRELARTFAQQENIRLDTIIDDLNVIAERPFFTIDELVNALDFAIGEDNVTALVGLTESIIGLDDQIQSVIDALSSPAEEFDAWEFTLEVTGIQNLIDAVVSLDNGLGRIEQTLETNWEKNREIQKEGFESIGATLTQNTESNQSFITDAFDISPDDFTSGLCRMLEWYKRFMSQCDNAGPKGL